MADEPTDKEPVTEWHDPNTFAGWLASLTPERREEINRCGACGEYDPMGDHDAFTDDLHADYEAWVVEEEMRQEQIRNN